MNWPILKQNIRYHYKKYLAILFASLAWLCLIGSMVMQVVYSYRDGYNEVDLLWIWNLVFTAVVYGTILVGNIRGTSMAFYGILLFVFSAVINAGMNLFLEGFSSFVAIFAGDAMTAAFGALTILATIASLVSGIFVYIRCRGFLSNTYASYRGLRNWTIVFCLLSALSVLFLPTLSFLLLGWSWEILTSFFAEIGDVMILVSIFFTVSRLKSEY